MCWLRVCSVWCILSAVLTFRAIITDWASMHVARGSVNITSSMIALATSKCRASNFEGASLLASTARQAALAPSTPLTDAFRALACWDIASLGLVHTSPV